MNGSSSTTRAIIYCRVSSEKQAADAKTSLDNQEATCRRACEDRDYKVVQVLNEVDKRWELDRPELAKAREAIRTGEADILMAMTVDRLSGDGKHLYLILDDIEKAGGRLEFADQELEDTPDGQFLGNLQTFLAEAELEYLAHRSRQGVQQKIGRRGVIADKGECQ